MSDLAKLLTIIHEVASGNYSNDIMSLTGTDTIEPVRSIAEAMGLMMVKVEAREYRLELLARELRELNETLRRNTIGTMSAMAGALAARDSYTEGHAERVGELARLIALEMGLDGDTVRLVHLAGLLHDIGKIGFPDQLFQPHESRNPPELVAEIKKHPAVGADILQKLDFLGPAVNFIRCHHERPDGKGYPQGLPVDQIPLGAKIIAVADGYDAMTTDRPYQKGVDRAAALAVLRKHAGAKWDQDCVEVFSRVVNALP